ncbi:MAG TPA: hypothetical protein PKV40_04990 [Candidatus Kapabacteria bacterium]|nr:hypothetical protein [Candidatus Kapabacteria bacterium]
MSGTINSLVDLNKIIQELHVNTGLYVVQVIKNGEILINDKITVVK